ncbi:four helix bundle protein, partial [bacterium]|nr:four helix bundle protein [bacterium]
MPKTNLKTLIKNFNFDKSIKTDFKPFLPYLTGEKEADLSGLSSNEIGSYSAIKTLWKLKQPKKPRARSRVWEDPKGYQYLAVWQNAALLRVLVRKWTTGCLPKSEYRLKAQMDDEARSTKRNIEEGWKRPTSSEYLQFLGYS